jgi:hypothetical protein
MSTRINDLTERRQLIYDLYVGFITDKSLSYRDIVKYLALEYDYSISPQGVANSLRTHCRKHRIPAENIIRGHGRMRSK